MKQLTTFMKIILFLTSYIPFYIMYWVIDFDYLNNSFPFIHFKTILSWIFFALSFSFFILIYMLKYFHNTTDKINVKLISVNKIDKEITSYLVTYILPLLTFHQGRAVILLIVLMLLICILYIKTDMLAINPILMLLGYSIVETEFKNATWNHSKHGIILSKINFQRIKNLTNDHMSIVITQVNNDLYIVMEVKNARK